MPLQTPGCTFHHPSKVVELLSSYAIARLIGARKLLQTLISARANAHGRSTESDAPTTTCLIVFTAVPSQLGRTRRRRRSASVAAFANISMLVGGGADRRDFAAIQTP